MSRNDLTNWEELIRSGQGEVVHKLLLNSKNKNHSPQDAIKFAQLCRRTTLYSLGFKKLTPFYLEARKAPRSHESLLAEYCALLTEVGAWTIADKIFSSLKPFKNAMTQYYYGLLYIKKWEYEAAEKCFSDFLKLSNDNYFRHFAQLNLISCFLFAKNFSKAEELCEDLLKNHSQLSKLAQGVLSEVQGELLFLTKGPQASIEHFKKSQAELKHSHHATSLYAEKWIHICQMSLRPDYLQSAQMIEFKKRVIEIGHWEILRELDRFTAKLTSNEALICKLFFGSPQLGYRRLLEREFHWIAPSQFLYTISKSQSSRLIFEGATGDLYDPELKKIPVSKLFSRLMQALSLDLYKPTPIGTLFELIYQKEYFDPDYSRRKAYQVVARFHAWSKSIDSQFTILSNPLGYSWSSECPLTLKFNKTQPLDRFFEKPEVFFQKIKSKFSQDTFTAEDIESLLELSRRSINRVLKQLEAAKLISCVGKGRSTKYRVR
jgi:hypothetical protein